MVECTDPVFKTYCEWGNFATLTQLVEFVVAILAFLMNIPHLFILTRKSMRTHITNSLMIGISIADMITLFMIINNRIYVTWLSPYDCFNFHNYPMIVARYVLEISMESMMRVSYYLGLCLALIRCIIMKMSRNAPGFLSTTRNGYFLTLFLIIISTLISCSYFYGYKIIKEKEPFTPGANCTGFPAKYSEPNYNRVKKKNQLIPTDVYEVFTASSDASFQCGAFLFTYSVGKFYRTPPNLKILIAALYPIFGLLLMFEVLKAAKVASTMLSRKDAVERYHTSRMILVMTIFYMLASCLTGTYKFVRLIVETISYTHFDMYFNLILAYCSNLFSALFCANALAHFLINLSMSRNYRNAVMELGCCPRRKAEVTMDTKSVNSTV
ncbi:G-protein coupled receptors family 1 profile domain-containing protein [Caenorhabditis elegans]|uniref:G-protein coupled receptors family 1 profile domain-containing protein n=1 Tax=Caenorhabditis elegans TaxID=6239 RepID=Q9XTR6_CAEEL|nr:G-protein coupled receptors family 1 profile domain-containing protein [Caenorhabditis elegans]CAB16548.3 G-protein coupled receptors family 1 profile domain-containing protein [Caenorhabditis elegans]|eukprot:NP_001346695.1 Serpentine Receptor, class W [Caenorhabditis elegans]